MLADGSTMIMLTIYFRYITKYWIYFHIFWCTMTLISFVSALFFAQESPRFLYSIKKYNEARNAFKRIALINRAKDMPSKYLFDTEIREVQKLKTA
jgi:hypothetical protein